MCLRQPGVVFRRWNGLTVHVILCSREISGYSNCNSHCRLCSCCGQVQWFIPPSSLVFEINQWIIHAPFLITDWEDIAITCNSWVLHVLLLSNECSPHCHLWSCCSHQNNLLGFEREHASLPPAKLLQSSERPVSDEREHASLPPVKFLQSSEQTVRFHSR